ncbi:MAG: TetR/AcrR family transcriptional regulator [Proteobacteria bacterium]|nr:TetR/AcrR family transcriptional regulator [Pseudomonadota bacterium]
MSRTHNPRTDRRAQRTRRDLTAAFVELVLSRGYEGVTTAEISRKANIGRSTFYLHYAGKQQLLEESLAHPSAGLAACVGGELTAPQLLPLLEHFRAQRSINRVFFEAPIRGLWVRSLAALIEPRLPRLPASAVPRSLLASVIAEAQIALVTHWLTAHAGLQPELVAQQLLAGTRALSAGAGAGVPPARPAGALANLHVITENGRPRGSARR